MNKTKTLLTAFAVLASLLMLMTPTMAGPVTEKTNMDIVESTEQEFINSLETLITNIQNDETITTLTEKLTNDRELNQMSTLIEGTEDELEKKVLAEDYLSCLEQKREYIVLEKYFELTYSDDMADILEQANKIIEELENTETDEASDELLIGGAIDLGPSLTNTIPTDSNIQSTTSSNDVDLITTSTRNIDINTDPNIIMNNDDTNMGGYAEPDWPGFMRNMNGDIYVPGEGWVSPDDPNYGNWLDLEDALQSLVIDLGDIGGFLFLLGVGLIFVYQYVFMFSLLCLVPASILQSMGFSGDFWLSLSDALLNLSVLIEIAAAVSILLGFGLMVISGDIPLEP